MSRIGKLCIFIPCNLKIILTPRSCSFIGRYGQINQIIPRTICIDAKKEGLYLVSKHNTLSVSKQSGLLHSLLKNHLIGVSNKFQKKLQLIGVGYRAFLESNKLILLVGSSYTTFFYIPSTLTITITTNINISIEGINKQAVCLFASKVRALKPPEPYKGKGIKYFNELIIRKAGKSSTL